MAVHTFRTTDSPSCGKYILTPTCRNCIKKVNPESVDEIVYVDEFFKLVTATEQAIILARGTKRNPKIWSIWLTKFLSNDEEVFNAFPESEVSKAKW